MGINSSPTTFYLSRHRNFRLSSKTQVIMVKDEVRRMITYNMIPAFMHCPVAKELHLDSDIQYLAWQKLDVGNVISFAISAKLESHMKTKALTGK